MAHIASTAAAHAAAAQEKQRREEQEEEEMTTYKAEDLESNWEFKIVRSESGQFRNPAIFQNLLEEESIGGWELVEKLDNRRVRFKRRKDLRKRDDRLPPGYDPYRSYYGSSGTRQTLFVSIGVGLMLLLGLGVFFIFNASTPDLPSGEIPFIAIATVIPIILVFISLLAAIFIRNRRG